MENVKNSVKTAKKRQKTTRIEPNEGEIEDLICKWLSFFNDGKVYKIAPSGFFNGKRFVKHRNKFILNGHPDVVFHYQGRVFYFEVKKPSELKYLMKHYVSIKNGINLNKKKLHLQEQILFVEDLRRVGHVAEFVCSLDMVREIIDKTLNRLKNK